MSVIGFGLTRIDAKKNQGVKGKIDIRNNVSLKDVLPADLSLGKEKNTTVKFKFEFTSSYEPKLGHILFEGEVVFMEDPKKIQETLDQWKKDKKVPQDVMKSVLTTILNKCNVQALVVSQDINLPPPIPLPKVEVGGGEQPQPPKPAQNSPKKKGK